MLEFFATTSRGMESVLAAEVRAFAPLVEEGRGGVSFRGELAVGYRACLWSRAASRVLLPLSRFEAEDDAQLYEGVAAIDWALHLRPGSTLAVDFVGTHERITNTRFGAQRVKDAIVDQLRERRGFRPSVSTSDPDLRIHLHLRGTAAQVSIDLAGESLHRRGWRAEGVEAPLKENLAAALLLFAGWPELAAAGGVLVDPMCGSGTLPIEAALIAADMAPGRLRPRFGLHGWAGHDPAAWQALLDEAEQRRRRQPPPQIAIRGSDHDERAVRLARANVERAGLAGWVAIERAELDEVVAPEGGAATGERGLVIANPPYGERLGDEAELAPLYQRLGDVMRRRFPGFRGAVFTGSPKLARSIGLRPSARQVLWNGPIECRLLIFPISTAPVTVEAPGWRLALLRPSPAAAMFANRVAKNLRHLRKWARREDVHCFRVYDADLPECAFALDLYEGHACLQEYAPPRTVDAEAAEVRRRDARLVLPAVLGIPPEALHLKLRRRQRPGEQYQRLADDGHSFTVRERGHRFWVNLDDYLDTGLFLDHRLVRALVEEQAGGRDVLNLFCYTGTATVCAAAGGARSTTSVDLSRTYLDWARRNLEENGIRGPAHRLVQAEVRAWLAEEERRFDLAFVAPPTFSNSKRMEGSFDVQRDHVALVAAVAERLVPGGVILLSAPLRRFRLEEAAMPGLEVEDLSAATLPPDFARSARDHHVFRLTRR